MKVPLLHNMIAIVYQNSKLYSVQVPHIPGLRVKDKLAFTKHKS